jgi:rhodanese-related sulfurtransferase
MGIFRTVGPATVPPRRRVRSAAFAASATLTLALGACSAGGTGASPATASEKVAGAIILDVRTPQEFAEGHLEGAVNLDVNAADFTTRLRDLDPAGRYLVYCRSGNRSKQAIDRMKAAGFTTLTDLGSVKQASTATGLAVVS